MSGDNLKAIDFYSSFIAVATDGKVGNAILNSNTTFLNFATVQAPGIKIEDLSATGSYISYTVGEDYVAFNNSDIYHINNFYKKLNAKTIINVRGVHFVGTNHGILKSSSTKQFLEVQPSSGKASIKAFWKDAFNDGLIYACGDNGVILKSANLGGMTIPYIKLEGEGRCVKNSVNLNYYAGSSNNCEWKINGTSVDNGCEDLSYYFDSVGAYDISVTATNPSGGQASVTKKIYMVEQPEINKSIKLSDSLLCKEESINIKIENSEPDVRYIIKKDESINSTIYGISPTGNGNTITLTTNLIGESGDYYLIAESTIASCSRNFTDRFHIKVEKTEARFASSLINAEINEPIVFSETSIDAQNFDWNFDSGSTPVSSSLSRISVKYKEPGSTDVNLKVSSDNGCFDDIEASGPNIYKTPTNLESSWTILYKGEDLYNGQLPAYGFPGYNDPEVMDLEPLDDGFLTSGYYNDLTFGSQIGINLNYKGKSGAYLAKHNLNGVLKWIVYSPGSQYLRSFIYDSAEDSQGNIYICGFTSGLFYDTYGNQINLNDAGNNGYIVKLDSKGRYIWRIVINQYYPKRIAIDKNDNVLTTGSTKSSYKNKIYFNGVVTTDEIATVHHNPGTGFSAVKLSSDGSFLWDSDIGLTSVNGAFLEDIGIDSNNNVYISGSFETRVVNYSAVNNSSMTLTGPINDYGEKMFISKYSESGEIIWQIKSLIEGGSKNNTTKSYDLLTDEEGDCYITGRNSATDKNLFHVFYNNDGTTTKKSAGQYYIAKVNTNGVCEWVNGAAHSYYGFGYQVDKDNDRIYVAGRFSNNEKTPEEAYFTSSNGIGYNLTLNPSDYFIAEYDLSGNLAKIIGNGKNPFLFYSERITGFFKDKTSDALYMTQNLGYFNGKSGFQNFGHVIAPTNGIDAAISRLTPQDGITFFTNKNLSLNENTLFKNDFKIYPNPTKNILNIDVESEIKETIILNSLGQVVLRNKDIKNIDVSELPNGIYFLKIKDTFGKTIIEKIIKN